jgi:hypothetical protein
MPRTEKYSLHVLFTYELLSIFQIMNTRKQTLHCTHWIPTGVDAYAVVVYCHGNCGSRTDAEQLMDYLLPSDISLFAFDFSGKYSLCLWSVRIQHRISLEKLDSERSGYESISEACFGCRLRSL